MFEKINFEAVAKEFVDAIRNYKKGIETRIFVGKTTGFVVSHKFPETRDDYGRRGQNHFNDHLIDKHETRGVLCLAVVGKGTHDCFKDCDLTELEKNIVSTFEQKILE